MTTNPSSNHTIWQQIQNLDFSLQIEKMVRDRGWRRRHAIEAAEQYRRMWYIWRKYGKESGPLPPSEDIDEFWHNHILATKQYQKDCDMVFGKFHHHNPYTGTLVGENEAIIQNGFADTQRLYQKEFGEPIYEIRPLYWQRLHKALKRTTKRFLGALLKPLSPLIPQAKTS